MKRYGEKGGNEMSESVDGSDLDRQVRMMSDSLAACKMMSNYRPTGKKETGVGGQTTIMPSIVPQTPMEILLPPEERTLECFSRNKLERLMVSYVVRKEPDFRFVTEDERVSNMSGVVFKEGSWWSWEETLMNSDGGSTVGMYRYEEVDPKKMVEVIQRELKALIDMAPTAALIVTGLSDNLFHYKECIRCKEKIRPALPWILNRIQKLRKYITIKNHGTYQWPNDFSYLRLLPKKPVENLSGIFETEKAKIQIGKLEKVDAAAVFDDKPGVQIVLDVKPKKGKKRFFEKLRIQKVSRRRVSTFPIFRLKEPSSEPLIEILRPTSEAPVAWDRKREIAKAKGFAVAVPALVVTPRPKVVESELVSTPVATAIAVQIAKSQIYPKPVQFYEERAFKVIQNPLTILVHQTPKKKEPEKKLRMKDFRANASELVQELLDEAEEEKMQAHKVKELEEEVKGLKDLMLEVHKNQVELSKVLLEKRVCSTPIIKLTDPNMLEEESQVLRRAAEVEIPGTRTSSVEALQLMVDDLKRKCDVKNRMLVTLLKGLRSDVPKEWWEELVDYIFDESKPVEAFDPEKVSEFVQQTSLFLSGGKKAPSLRSRCEEQPSEGEADSKASSESTRTTVSCLKGGLKSFSGDTNELEETSTQATSEFADSDLTSNVTTEHEDMAVPMDRIARKMLSGFWDSKKTSSFIQRILYEDSCAGVAVVDLFVALKRVKDELDVLTRFNSEFLTRIRELDLEAEVAKREYKVLSLHMQAFRDKIDVETKIWRHTVNPKNDSFINADFGTQKLFDGAVAEQKVQKIHGDHRTAQDLCCKCAQGLWIRDNQLECVARVSDHINTSTGNVPVSLTSFLGAIVTSVTELKSFKAEILPIEVFTGFCEEELDFQKSEENSNEPSVKMICDVDDLSVLEPQVGAKRTGPVLENKTDEPGESCKTVSSIPQKPIKFESEDDSGSPAKTSDSRELFCWNCSTKGLQEWMLKDRSCGKEGWTNHFATHGKNSDEGSISESESVFEEALSEPYGSKARASVTCMGDLTKAAKGKKSASTLTAASDVAFSWIGKLTEDIKSKILNLKPFKKTEMVEKKFAEMGHYSEALEFKITASTPIGVFDVTVKQYKDGKEVSEFIVGLEEPPTVTVTPMTHSAGSKPNIVTTIKGENVYWSDESLTHSECEPVEGASNSGDDEMEEFVEVTADEGKDKDKKKGKALRSQKSTLAQESLKINRAPFFEIQKCHPRHFVQEIVPKNSKRTRDPTIQNEKILGTVTVLEDGKVTDEAEHKLVFENSSDDLVIYIQVEVEGGEDFSKRNKCQIGEHTNDLVGGTIVEDPVTLRKEWRENSDNSFDVSVPEEIFRKKTVTFIDETSELMMEKEIREMLPEEEPKVWGNAVTVVTLYNVQRARILLPQKQQQNILRTERKTIEEVANPVAPPELPQPGVAPDNFELEKALNLIRDIENDIIEIKLSEAISILPNLECELRKHLQQKIQTIADKESPDPGSVDNFLSADELWNRPELPLPEDHKSDDSEERLQNLLVLLSDLEEAVKSNEVFKHQVELCDRNSSKVYQLLHALANSIRQLENDATIVTLSETLDIASQLDTAVREYDSIVKKQPLDYVTPGKGKTKGERVCDSNEEKEEMTGKEHLKNVRKKVFEMVEDEAMETEGRIERDFDRIDRLQRENEESIKFVQAFLEKTKRRAAELNTVKTELQKLSGVLSEMYLELVKLVTARNLALPHQQTVADAGRDHSPLAKEVPVRDTVSGLLLALNDLKARAIEKKEVCRGILERVSSENSTSQKGLLKKSSRSSKSSYTATNSGALFSSVREFKRIGESSLYLSWSKPEGALADSIVGYEILVNGKLNQKVRNPQRLQAVLYSVNLSKQAEVKLFAVVDNEPRVLLTTATYFIT